MNRIAAGLGVTVGIAAGLLITYCMRDDVIREKLKESVAAVGNFAQLMKEQADKKQAIKDEQEAYQTRQNQQWADQQWEALGI